VAIDKFPLSGDLASYPARTAFDITPGATELAVIPKAIYVGGTGTIVLRAVDSSADVTFQNVPSGFILDVRAQFVKAGTTATGLIGLA